MPDPLQAALVKAGASALQAVEDAARGFLLKVAGPVGEETGLLLQDKVRIYRFKNQIKALARAKQMMEDAGLEPSSVPFRTLLPLLDGAALEDEPDLAEKWAALLANAANPEERDVPPSYPAILSELSPGDAAILDSCAVMFDSEGARLYRPVDEEWLEELPMDRAAFDISVDNLERLGLVVGSGKHGEDEETGLPQVTLKLRGRDGIAFTHLGWAFAQACEPPEAPGV